MDAANNGLNTTSTRQNDPIERRLFESEQRLALAQRAGHVGVFDWDIPANHILATPETEAIYGLPSGTAHYTFKDFIQLVHPDDQTRIQNETTATLAARKTEMDAAFRIVRPDGVVRHLAQRALVSYDADGQPLRMIGTSLDITGRILADHSLRMSEEKFSRAFHLSPDSININRLADGVYIDVNEGFQQILGWSRAEVLGRSSLPGDLNIWVHADDRARMIAILKANGIVNNFEALFRHKDGTLIPGLMSARIMEVNGEQCLLTMTRDITERKRVKEALQQHNALLNAVINSTQDGIFSVDRSYRYTQFNQSHARFIKDILHIDIKIGESILDHQSDPGIRANLKSNFDRALAGERVEFEYPVEGDPLKRIFWISHNQVRTPDGEVTGIAVFVRDHTEQRRLQEQLLQAQKMEAIGQLAGGIAHDFRNQLTVIKGFCELLQEGRDVLPSGQFLLSEILNAARQSTELTDKLLGFSRKQMLQPRLVDLAELVADAGKLLPRLLREDVKLLISAEPGPLSALLDPVQFQHALFNLATNARDAMPHGGELRIHCRLVQPDPAFRRRHPSAAPGCHIAVTVSDTGHGMDESTLTHIFEPFYTTKPAGQGTGLGLPMVYGFVKQCNGIINVQSAPGAGASFTLLFPEATGPKSAPAAPHAEPRELTGTERILLVEDEAAVRRVVLHFLSAAGYHPVETTDSREALAHLADPNLHFDLLLSDVVMPDLSGMDLAQHARRLRPKLPVLLMSGYTNAQLLERGLKNVNGTYLAKPFGRTDLLRAVRHALDTRTPANTPPAP